MVLYQFEFGRLPLSIFPVSGTGLSLLAFCHTIRYFLDGVAKELKQAAPSLAQNTERQTLNSNGDIAKNNNLIDP